MTINKRTMHSQRDNSEVNVIDPGYCGSVVNHEKPDTLLQHAITKIKPLLRPVYRQFRHFLILVICKLRKDYKGIIFVDPLEIKHTVNKYDSTLKRNDMCHFGSVADGDWDLGGLPIKEYGYIYPILKQRIELGMAYDDIPEFNENLKFIEQGEKPDNCSTENQYREKWLRIEIVCDLLKKNGYKSQKELQSGYPFNEIRVQVGRHGDLLFEEGMHRLAISQFLGFKRIPVIVTRRHAEWVRQNGNKIYKNEL